jgi:hypothetical protein
MRHRYRQTCLETILTDLAIQQSTAILTALWEMHTRVRAKFVQALSKVCEILTPFQQMEVQITDCAYSLVHIHIRPPRSHIVTQLGSSWSSSKAANLGTTLSFEQFMTIVRTSPFFVTLPGRSWKGSLPKAEATRISQDLRARTKSSLQ